MSQYSFFESVYKFAEQLKGSPLTGNEKQQILQHYKVSQKIEPLDKALEAIENVIGKEFKVLLEQFSAVSLDSVDILLAQMRKEADSLNDKK